MQKFFKYILPTQLVMALALTFAPMAVTHAQIEKSCGNILQGTNIPCSEAGDPKALIKKVLNYALGFLTLFVVIMVIYGGLTYILNAGDEAKAKKGMAIIKHSLIGLIIILLSWTIVSVVFRTVEGVQGGSI